MMENFNFNGEDVDQSGRKIAGVAVGIVTSNEDDEKLGRVKVKFNWKSEDNVTKWARIATLSSGPDRGSMFIPEVEDEVLLAFERGNINRPFVVGSIWNDEGKPPGFQSENTLKKLKTRSGHELIFYDKEGKEKIEILSKSGHKIILDDDPKTNQIIIKNNKKDKELDSIIIDSNKRSIKIESAKTLELKSVNITIEAKNKVTIKGATVSIN